MSIEAFIKRCDEYAAEAGISRATLSNKLFKDSRKVADLAAGTVDVGVRKLQAVEVELDSLFTALRGPAATGDPPAAAAGA